jgi:hypothetical protein
MIIRSSVENSNNVVQVRYLVLLWKIGSYLRTPMIPGTLVLGGQGLNGHCRTSL